MKFVAAYLLAVLGGNAHPDKSVLKKIIEAGGGTFDSNKADLLLAQLKGKDINELLAEGKAKIQANQVSVAAVAAAAAPVAVVAETKPAEPEKKVEVKEEKKEEEEEDIDMFGLFDE